MLALAVRLLLLGTPVLSDADLRIVERLAWRAGVPRGAVESLSTDVTGDGAPDVVLLTRTADRLVLFVAEGPVSPVGRWWRVDLHRGNGAGELCVPASAARVQVEDHGVVSHALECDRERTGACPTPQGRALASDSGSVSGGARLLRWQRSPLLVRPGAGRRSPTASIPAGPMHPRVSPVPAELTEPQADALRELTNVAAGHAARALSTLLGGEKFGLWPPLVRLVDAPQLTALLGGRGARSPR